MFRSKLIKYDGGRVRATRFVISWYRAGGQLVYVSDYTNFRNWLRSLGVCEKDIELIEYQAVTGKLELELNAMEFLNAMRAN